MARTFEAHGFHMQGPEGGFEGFTGNTPEPLGGTPAPTMREPTSVGTPHIAPTVRQPSDLTTLPVAPTMKSPTPIAGAGDASPAPTFRGPTAIGPARA